MATLVDCFFSGGAALHVDHHGLRALAKFDWEPVTVRGLSWV